MCHQMLTNFEQLKVGLLADVNDDLSVQMLHFVKREEKTKKGKVVKRLKAEAVQASISWVLSFIEDLLPSIIHHRNLFLSEMTDRATSVPQYRSNHEKHNQHHHHNPFSSGGRGGKHRCLIR